MRWLISHVKIVSMTTWREVNMYLMVSTIDTSLQATQGPYTIHSTTTPNGFTNQGQKIASNISSKTCALS